MGLERRLLTVSRSARRPWEHLSSKRRPDIGGTASHSMFDSREDEVWPEEWSAMNFNRHWRQRVAVALGRGQALIISRAAERAHRRRRTQLGKHPREHSPYDSW